MKTLKVIIIEDGSPSVAFVKTAPSACRLATAIESLQFAAEMDPLYLEKEPVLEDGTRRTQFRARQLAPARPAPVTRKGTIDRRTLPPSEATLKKMSIARRKYWAGRKAAALANRTPIE